MSAREVRVYWCDANRMLALSKERGCEDGGPILDYVEECECEDHKELPSVAKAKVWAARNRALDLWHQPSIFVFEWPSETKRDWERETVRHLRYVGDGLGWEDMEEATS